MAREKDWGPSGYDRVVADRWLYAIGDRNSGLVKVGMVLDEERLTPRLSEIRRKNQTRQLEMLARSVVPAVNHEEVEHVESTARLWLTRARGFSFIGEVDWLAAPNEYDFALMQEHLSEAIAAAIALGK